MEYSFKNGVSSCFRIRCHAILLKSEDLTSKEVGLILGMYNISVNSWTKLFVNVGINGLETQPDRGRKPIISKVDDREAILKAIKEKRQRMLTAKVEWDSQSGKSVCRNTFHTFLKPMAEEINE